MRQWQLVLKNLLRRPTRTLLTIVGLSIAVSAVVALVGIAYGFERSFLQLYNERGFDLVVQRAGGSQSQAKGLPEDLYEKIQALPGVQQVVGGILDVIHFPEANLQAVLINSWRIDCPLWKTFRILSGRPIQADDEHGVVLGKVLAANLGKKPGDTVEIYLQDFTVVAVIESSSVYENGGCFVLLETLQRCVGKSGKVTGFTIRTDFKEDPAALDDLRRKVESLQRGLEVKKTADFIDSLMQIRLVRSVTWMTSAIALVIGAIGMLNTMVMSVYERAKEIGTLRALGWRKIRIIRMILAESLILSVCGAILGTVTALVLTHFFSRLPTASGLVQGDIAPLVIIQGFVIAILVGLLGAAYPAWWGANLQPMDALRRK